MRPRHVQILATLLACAPLLASESDQPEPPPQHDDGDGLALVELFTSQGCSSCPPADDVAAAIIENARDRPVHVVVFHVDYWDYLGWEDRFARPAFTARQRDYARRMDQGRLSTPQMIVNGRTSFVGSDAPRATREIESALAEPAAVAVQITLDPDVRANLRYALDYAVSGWERLAQDTRRHAALHIAVVERGLVTEVVRGENAGRTLRHDNVVRWFGTLAIPEAGRGDALVHVPAAVDWGRAEIIAWVQDARAGPVLGAARTPLATSRE